MCQSTSDEEWDNLWVAGLGNSTVVLAYEDDDGTGYGEGLLTLHNTGTPKEYPNIAMMHPSEEKDTIMEKDQLLGLGGYALKLPAEFSTELFFKLPRGLRPQHCRDGTRYYNVAPPYVLNSSSPQFINLVQLRPHKSTLVLYTRGVDTIVNGNATISRRVKKLDKPDPATVVGQLVGSQVDETFI
ncbi:uncharacterized protein EV420DRAFT_1483866 [Desarmillaria tabescens]|uniref:Uncharacterized protein n=1 Tax=Armillaria tabescens TaxID=1929756 RepID=A0AA39JT34_ARMTA|nr:uncharacterized protein EV420DRAFT_1483866 [Desarmillaria tabescens]KAK0446964.1 hypothetical protein EV420DRAFT_1483866 [Desarmillaria tabescens]